MIKIFCLLRTLWLFSYNTILLICAARVLVLLRIGTRLGALSTPLSSAFMYRDFVSRNLVTLTSWIYYLIFLVRLKFVSRQRKKLFLLLHASLFRILILCFFAKHLIGFYMLFEFTLIPITIIVLGWGYQPERIEAGFYLLLYTVLASLPLLLSLVLLRASVPYASLASASNIAQSSLGPFAFFLLLAFFTKLPIYFTHLWLPKAHVEAPVTGSIVLAGVLLKLGGYGLLRVLPLLQPLIHSSQWAWRVFGLTGGAWISSICAVQTDLKALVAYTSVAHIALILAVSLSLSPWSVRGRIRLMIAHGLSSSGLFFAANLIYLRSTRRSLLINKGILTLVPSFTLRFFLLNITNIAGPPSLNLARELLILLELVAFSPLFIGPLTILIFFSAAYSLYLYASTQYGKTSPTHLDPEPVAPLDLLVFFSHLFPLFVLVLGIPLWL